MTSFPHYKSREQEMAEIMGMALAANAGRGLGYRTPSEESLRAASLVRKCQAMVRQGESPWVTFRHMIAAGHVTLTKRRNRPPLLKIVKRKRGLRSAS